MALLSEAVNRYQTPTDELDPIIQIPPSGSVPVGIADPNPVPLPGGSDSPPDDNGSGPVGPTVEDLYPSGGTGSGGNGNIGGVAGADPGIGRS